jgi:hypothetical protein
VTLVRLRFLVTVIAILVSGRLRKVSIYRVGFPSKEGHRKLEYSFQHMPGSLLAQSQKMNSSQTELNNNWIKVSYKRDRSTQEGPGSLQGETTMLSIPTDSLHPENAKYSNRLKETT